MEDKLYLKRDNIMDRWFSIWAFFIPITTVILIPSIKMTVVSIIFSCISPLIVIFFFKEIRKKYIIDIIKFYYIYCFIIITSQLSNIVLPITFDNVLITPSNEGNSVTVFRHIIITSTAYVTPGLLTFYCAKYFYNKKWDRYIINSGLVFALYALYKWGYFLFTGEDGDFLSNKMYDADGNVEDLATKLYQGISILGLNLQRLQGLADEPSMYAFTMLPYFIFAIQKKANIFVILIIGITLLLSTSTTAYMGLIIYFILLSISKRVKKKNIFCLLVIFVVLYIIFKDYIDIVINLMIVEKLFNAQTTESGLERSSSVINSFMYWSNLDIAHMLFGIGVGYIRSFDFFTSLLVNVGIIGLILFSYFILKDIKLKHCDFIDINNNAIILILFVTLMTSVPEVWFPSFWLFIGIIRSKRNIT